MRDELLRRLEREALDGEGRHFLEGLRSGGLHEDQLSLAAYLGHELSQIATDFTPEHDLALGDWVWGLWDWGRLFQARVVHLLFRSVLPTADPRTAAIFAEIEERLDLGESVDAGELADLDERLEFVAVAMNEELLELTGRTFDDPHHRPRLLQILTEVLSVAGQTCETRFGNDQDTPISTAEALELEALGAAYAATQAVLEAAELLSLDRAGLQTLVRSGLLDSVWDRHYPKVRGGSVRAFIRLADFERRKTRAAPDAVQRLAERDWEYMPSLPFGDDDETRRKGRPSKELTTVCAFWRYDDDAIHFEVSVHLVQDSPGRTGFRFVLNESNQHRLAVSTRIPADYVTRLWFEACMLAWGALRRSIVPTRRLASIGAQGLRLFHDATWAPPLGWISVPHAEEVIAILLTCQVSELSLDHDPDWDGASPASSVLTWLEQQTTTQGFVPPEELIAHSPSASAREDMEAAIARIKLAATPQA